MCAFGYFQIGSGESYFLFFDLNLIFGVCRNWQNIWYMGNRDRILGMMQPRDARKSGNSKNQPGSVFTICQLRFLLFLWLTMNLGLWTLNTFGLALEISPGLINKPSKFLVLSRPCFAYNINTVYYYIFLIQVKVEAFVYVCGWILYILNLCSHLLGNKTFWFWSFNGSSYRYSYSYCPLIRM